jgi:hypothetical protein
MLFRETCLASIYWAVGDAEDEEGLDSMAEQTFDTRMTRDEESRMTAGAAVGLHAIKYQALLLRMWADNAELFARNYERGLETFSSAAKEQWKRAA